MVTLESFTAGALNFGIIIAIIIVGGGFILLLLYAYFKYKKWKDYDCIIWDAGKITETKDKGGIFIDPKTKNKRFFLRKANVGLAPDDVPYKMGEGGKKIVYLHRDGLKNFKYVNIGVREKNISVNVEEEDVNWAINAYERQKKMFSQSLLMQLMPFIALAFTAIIILIIFIYFFKDFEVLKDVAINLKEASLSCTGKTIIG
jgi:hypothetical protein|tara:strand:+ start:1015 stop:1620 length:606 start_codon:yes stop_codon:yes gene_type:complete